MNIIWTQEALNDSKSIYNYYKANASINVARNIKTKIFSSTKNLQKLPRKCQKEELLKFTNEDYRYIVAGNYKIIYKNTEENIYIIKVFDCRRNPERIKDQD